MNNKEKYCLLAEKETDMPLYNQPWWLNAACGENGWNVFTVLSDDKIIAAMPYQVRNVLGFRISSIMLFTKNPGIWMKYPENQKYVTRLRYEKETYEKLISQIEQLNLHYFKQNMHYGFTNWMPFYWKKFKQTTAYSYVFDSLHDLDEIFRNFDTKIKTDIRKAEKILTIKDDLKVEDFISINRKTFERQGKKMPYSSEILLRVDHACEIRNGRKIIYGYDENNNIHAAIYLVWDNQTVYYLLSGGDPNFRNSGANALLLWNAICFAAKEGKKFDFEGSMMPAVETFVRAFGASQKQFHEISKVYSPFLRFFVSLKYIIKS